MFSLEPFRSGSKKRHITQAEIDKLRKNMQKVPVIQKKVDDIQANESKKADESLQNQVKQLQSDSEQKNNEEQSSKKKRREKALQRIASKMK